VVAAAGGDGGGPEVAVGWCFLGLIVVLLLSLLSCYCCSQY